MARLEPSKITGAENRELCKRQHVPYRVVDTCPSCGRENTVDLAKGDHYLSSPAIDKPALVYFYCRCEHEWQVKVVVHVTIELQKEN